MGQNVTSDIHQQSHSNKDITFDNMQLLKLTVTAEMHQTVVCDMK